jgi:nucleoporin p58/p45
LFGNNQGQQQQQQNQTTPSLFGNTQNQTQNQATPSLFGNTQNQTLPAFGATNTQNTNPLFGGTNTTGTQQSNPFGGFGASQSTQPNQQTSNIFGGAQTNQPAQASNPFGGFGASTTGVGNSMFGQKPAQSNLGLSTMQTQAPLFSKSTKFNDLPDELKKLFESIDSHIQGRVQISKDLHQQKVGEESMKGQELIRNVQKELAHTSSITHSDFLFKDDLKAKVDQAVQDTIIATRIVDGFKNPQQNGAYLKNYASFPLEYFARVAEGMKERLRWYQSTIEQIERKLALTANHAPQSPQAIAATLQAQHSTFISLANKTAMLDAELDKIKKLYTQLWRARTGSMRDPFSDVDRANGGEFGIGGLTV